MSSDVLLYCDEGPGIGLGHRARCEAIAAALRARGRRAAVQPVGRGIVAAPVVVVDSYRVRADDRRHFVPDTVIAIDDLERDMAVDCIVAPSPGARPGAYSRAARVLAGARYALLGPSTVAARHDASLVGSHAPRVLVTTGAADQAGVGARIAGELRAHRPDVDVQLVVGPWGSDALPEGVTAVAGSTTLGATLLRADIVVTAAGVTLLEALFLARPCVTFAIADNQRANCAAVGEHGAALVSDIAGAAEAACSLLDDADRRARLSAAGSALVDGHGAARVADAIITIAARQPTRHPALRSAGTEVVAQVVPQVVVEA